MDVINITQTNIHSISGKIDKNELILDIPYRSSAQALRHLWQLIFINSRGSVNVIFPDNVQRLSELIQVTTQSIVKGFIRPVDTVISVTATAFAPQALQIQQNKLAEALHLSRTRPSSNNGDDDDGDNDDDDNDVDNDKKHLQQSNKQILVTSSSSSSATPILKTVTHTPQSMDAFIASVKILMQIPGVSESRAIAILRAYSTLGEISSISTLQPDCIEKYLQIPTNTALSHTIAMTKSSSSSSSHQYQFPLEKRGLKQRYFFLFKTLGKEAIQQDPKLSSQFQKLLTKSQNMSLRDKMILLLAETSIPATTATGQPSRLGTVLGTKLMDIFTKTDRDIIWK